MIEPISILTTIVAWLAIKGIEFLVGLAVVLVVLVIYFSIFGVEKES